MWDPQIAPETAGKSHEAPQAELQAAQCNVAVVPTTDIGLVDAAACARSRRGGARQSRDASRRHCRDRHKRSGGVTGRFQY